MGPLNIKLEIEYSGEQFAGWQFQPQQRTIQGELEKAVFKLTSKKVTIYGAGRTDAGVHALGQTANFHIDHKLPLEKYRDGLNFYLPDDILVRSVHEMPESFHSRYDAVYRHYQYRIAQARTVMGEKRRWEIDRSPDPAKLEMAADMVRGEHDFSAFCVVASQKENNRCLLYESRWRRMQDELVYDITADRFLHTMIRSLVGLMMDLGTGGLTMLQFRKIFSAGDHRAIRHVAPAHGLYLVDVGY
jgi:tRNA pseudouridine38-40 synthase